MGDGHARREFLYAGDLADCLMRGVTEFESMPSVMNVGLGYDLSINEFYETVAEVTGYEGKFTHDLIKPAGMAKKLVDIARLNEWGWKPQTELKEGIRKTYDFFRTTGVKEEKCV